MRWTTRHAGDQDEMFRRMAFNVLAHNRDDHLKNHAFLMDAGGGWRLSPAYDVSFSDGPGGEHHLAIADWPRHADAAGVPSRRTKQIAGYFAT